MNEVILDGREMQDNPHEYMKKELELPDYYGKNLDALYDCLTEMNKSIVIKNSELVDKKILDTFIDADEENPYITLLLEIGRAHV